MTIKKHSIIMPLPDDELINSFEDYYEVILPEDFKAFLKQNNGAIPETKVFEQGFVVDRFLGLLKKPIKDNVNGQYDIGVVITQLDERIVVDEDATGCSIIPIAAMFSGNFVCLDYRRGEEPSVAIWFHEESEELHPVLRKVANTFTEFLAMLR